MEKVVIKAKNITIRDEEILNRLKKLKIEFIHLVAHKEENGSVCIIAKQPENDELTIPTWYYKISISNNSASIRTPNFLKKYLRKTVYCYIERLFKEKNELFRMQAVNFMLDINSKKDRRTAIDKFPYFTKNGEFVIPQYYLNKNLKHQFCKMKVSMSRTNKNILNQNFIFVFLIKLKDSHLIKDNNLFGFRKFSNGIRTKKLTFFIEYLKKNNKTLNNYRYITTVPYNNYPYGLIVFEEKR